MLLFRLRIFYKQLQPSVGTCMWCLLILSFPALFQVLHEKSKDSLLVGRVSVPTVPGKGEIIPINIQPNQLRHLHARLVT